jgi:hypothetical protein
MTQQDIDELKRLAGMGMQRVICDASGQRGAVDNFGHIELVKDGLLMEVTPFTPMNIEDALRAAGARNA